MNQRYAVVVGFVALAISLSANAKAAAEQTIKDPISISKFVHSIPAYRGDLGSRLSDAGMGVESIWVQPLTKEQVAEDPMNFAPGDVVIHVFTTGTPNAQGCRVLGSPYLIKRGKKYITQDRTGYWLLTGRCDF
ncbi:hypothetical protein [Paraburkholderia terrae]|uniref:DUF4440 domain-containing protein n=1 Tax=Paraburkholderia terrae TaxID=311230 RepID=A0A2I8ETC8_9BURK|nr:hypothetical protein [Paraburkholderia terrae]AUT62865.1 hypothetical protein C2L65_25145 [Paraburkholderia terrae]